MNNLTQTEEEKIFELKALLKKDDVFGFEIYDDGEYWNLELLSSTIYHHNQGRTINVVLDKNSRTNSFVNWLMNLKN